MRITSHDEYGSLFGECECARCRPAPEPDEPQEPETDEAAEWGGIDYP